ncbi:hypothetical protein LX81_01477 [Palleronia aestuarii]|uniref:Uncharacterized protein n=1 Tax=Palleronia aestuarii TaxID=568105 RepID=A0A2W7Q7I9_9RHOB|nr:hypothetical protein LX81_01477 [Palleronia aestuarii]
MTWRELWRSITGRGLAEDLERNRKAADKLDAAVKEMFKS